MQDVESDIRKVNSQMSKSGGSMSSFTGGSERGLKSLGKWGSSLQWTGRQLGYNFTLPIVAAGAAATKFALDQERAMTRVRKVYGDDSIKQWAESELGALEKAFVALSNRYGVAMDETADIAAEWAAAGVSGRALAESVQLTMKTMVLGEMNAADATQALISIQAQYGFNTRELTDTMARLNAVENSTGTTTQDLITAFARTAGVARNAGVSVRELAGFVAALTPAAGSAAQAGNALKTIIGRIMSPTEPATQVLREMGIATEEVGWQSMSATQRLEELARQFPRLTDAQKQVVSTTLASLHQTNKFEAAMREISAEAGYYHTALRVAADDADYFAVAERELNAVLDSSPQKVKQAGVILQNSMVKVIQPLLPLIVGTAQWIANLATRFSELSPEVRKLIVVGLLLLASLGLIARYVGAMATLVSVLGGTFGWLGGAIMGSLRFFGLFRAKATADMVATTAAAGVTSMGTVATMRAQFLKGFPGLVGLWTAMKNRVVITMVAMNIGVSTRLVALKNTMWLVWSTMWAGMQASMVARVTAIQGFLTATMVPSFVATITNMRIAIWARWSVMWSYMMAPITGFIARSKTALLAHWATLKLWATAGGTMGVWSAFWIRMQLVTGIALARMKALTTAFGAPFVAAWKWIGDLAKRTWAAAKFSFVAIDWTFNTLLVGGAKKIASPFIAAWALIGRLTNTLWTRLKFAFVAIDWSFNTLLLGGAKRIAGPFIAIWGALGTAVNTLWSGLKRTQVAIEWIWNTVLLGGVRKFGGLFVAAWGLITRGAAAVWAAGLGAMRAMYAVFVATVSAPGFLLGAFKRMGTVIAAGFRGILSIMAVARTALIAIITSPWAWAVAAVIGIIILFRDQIKQVWDNVVNYFSGASDGIVGAFDKLPNGVKNAFLKVVAFVKAAAQQVYEWMSYLNPFARHSPSLVDNVTNGLAVVRAQYGTLTQIAGPIGKAYAGIKSLSDVSANLRKGAASISLAKDIEDLSKAAPRVVPAFINLSNILTELKNKAEALESVIDGQQQTVDTWKQALDDASDALDIQEKKLSALEDVASGYEDAISELQDAISTLAGTPLQGIGAMEDQIFDNEMAQKRLRLEIMRMEDAGQSYEAIEDRIASLNGEIESLQGTQNDLRSAGAGSEVLGFYDQQIKAIEEQKKAMRGQSAPIQQATDALAELERQAEVMDLTKSLQFDPLSRQISTLR